MKTIYKYRVLLLILLSGVLLFGKIHFTFNVDYAGAAQSFQQHFLQKEQQLDRFTEIQRDLLRHRTDFAKWKNHSTHSAIFLHVFSGDSLIYWNTNRLPIRQFADIHFPSEGIIHLQNGWYYAKQIKENNLSINPESIMRLLRIAMIIVEQTGQSGSKKKEFVTNLLREVITNTDSISSEHKREALNMISGNIVSDSIDFLIDASKGKFNINKVEEIAQEVAKSCFTLCLERFSKKK